MDNGDRWEIEERQMFDRACSHEFAGFVCANGHAHTLKAYGEFNQWAGSPHDGIENQWDYYRHVCEAEQTYLGEFTWADDEKLAKVFQIIDEEGGWI